VPRRRRPRQHDHGGLLATPTAGNIKISTSRLESAA
jgi:hypothetical protein